MSRDRPHHPLVGRVEEQQVLTAACAQARAGGAPTVLITGRPGVGRSALLDAAVRSAGVPARTARGLPLEREFPFALALRLLVPRPEDAPADRCDAALTELLRTGRRSAVTEDADVVRALVALLARRAGAGPMVLAVDDLQDADPQSVGVVAAAAAARIPGVALLLTARGAPASVPAALGTVDDLRLLEVEPLGTADVAQLAGVPQDEAARLRARTAGNAWLLTELLAADGSATGAVPASVVAAVRRRLSAGTGPTDDVATALAVLGDRADRGLLDRITGLEASALEAALHGLESAGALEPGALVLRPPLLRDALAEDLAGGRGAALRLRAAEALGPDDASLAAELLLGATAHPEARSRWAVDLALRAAGSMPEGSVERLALLRHALEGDLAPTAQARARAALGVTLAHHDAAAGVEELAVAQGLEREPRAAAEIAVDRAEALFHLSRMEEASRVAADALATLAPGRSDDRELRLRLQVAGLAADAARGRLVEPRVPPGLLTGPVRTLGERALLARLSWVLATTGGVSAEEVLRLAHRAMGGSALLDAAGGTSPAFVYGVSALVLGGDPDAAAADAGDAARRARDDGSPVGLAYALALRGQADVARGRILDAAADAQTALGALAGQEADAPTDLPARAVAMAWRVETAVELGAPDQAAADLDAAGFADDLPDLGPVHLLLLARAGLRAAMNDPGAALADLELLRERVGDHYANPSALPWQPRAAALLDVAGEPARARELIEAATDRAERFGEPRALGRCLRVRGVLRGGSAATTDLERAVELLAEHAPGPEHARALLDLGTVRHRASDRRARPTLRAGLLAAHGAGAIPVVDDALRRLRATGARPRRPRVPGSHALRPQRRQVIELAAAGLDDRQIADRLFLRPQTVAEHVELGLQALELADREALRGSPAR